MPSAMCDTFRRAHVESGYVTRLFASSPFHGAPAGSRLYNHVVVKKARAGLSDNYISTGSSSSESSSPSSFRSALRSVRSVWLTLHAVNRRFIHPIFFSRSSARALVLSLFRTHVCMAIEAAFPTTCSSLVTSPASSLLFLSGMESVSAGSVQAITGAILHSKCSKVVGNQFFLSKATHLERADLSGPELGRHGGGRAV